VEPAEVQLTLTNDPSAEPGATDDAQLGANRLTHAIIVLGTIVFRSCDTSDDDVTLDGPLSSIWRKIESNRAYRS